MISTHLKNISQIGNLPQVGMNIKKYLKPPPSYVLVKKTHVLITYKKYDILYWAIIVLLWHSFSHMQRLTSEREAIHTLKNTTTLRIYIYITARITKSMSHKFETIFHLNHTYKYQLYIVFSLCLFFFLRFFVFEKNLLPELGDPRLPGTCKPCQTAVFPRGKASR